MRMSRALAVASLSVLAAAPAAPSQGGGEPFHFPGPSRLRIEQVLPDAGLGLLRIRGKDFRQSPRDHVFVTLAGEPLTLLNLSPTEILVQLPPGLVPGTYRLAVLSRRGFAKVEDAIDVSLGGGAGPAPETDPQVGVLTPGAWCTSNGASVECVQPPPVLAESDPRVGVVGPGAWCAGNAGGRVDCDRPAPALAGQSCPRGSVTGLDPAGAVTCRPRVGFLARRATIFAIPFGSLTTVPFDQEVYDEGNAFDAATGIFTAPVAGFYAFSGAIMVQGMSPGGLYYMHLVAGGFNHGAAGGYSTSSDWNTANASAVIYLNAGESARLMAYSVNGWLYGNPAGAYLWTYLQGGLLE